MSSSNQTAMNLLVNFYQFGDQPEHLDLGFHCSPSARGVKENESHLGECLKHIEKCVREKPDWLPQPLHEITICFVPSSDNDEDASIDFAGTEHPMNQLDLAAKYNDVCRELAETKQELEKVKEDMEEMESDLAHEMKDGLFHSSWLYDDDGSYDTFEENIREIYSYEDDEDLQARFGWLLKIAKEHDF